MQRTLLLKKIALLSGRKAFLVPAFLCFQREDYFTMFFYVGYCLPMLRKYCSTMVVLLNTYTWLGLLDEEIAIWYAVSFVLAGINDCAKNDSVWIFTLWQWTYAWSTIQMLLQT